MRFSLDQQLHGNSSSNMYLVFINSERCRFIRYPRYSHTLTSFDVDGDGEGDYMLLMGGYAPTPINDVWVTEDGVTWA
jgi:hypothetical protein